MTINDEPTAEIFENKQLLKIINTYCAHKDRCKRGMFGKTAQFYITYIDLINYYHLLSRSIRSGDFQLFKYILSKIVSLFFVTNQSNYARWLQRYHDNLLKLNETHPELERAMNAGYLGIKRTNKCFSRQPIDLTLEQTINADAGRRLTGVIHFTNSISARQRWAKSHDIRTSVISHTMNVTKLSGSNDITADLEFHAIKKNAEQLEMFISTFEKFFNPFDTELDPNFLFNIASGRAARMMLKIIY